MIDKESCSVIRYTIFAYIHAKNENDVHYCMILLLTIFDMPITTSDDHIDWCIDSIVLIYVELDSFDPTNPDGFVMI